MPINVFTDKRSHSQAGKVVKYFIDTETAQQFKNTIVCQDPFNVRPNRNEFYKPEIRCENESTIQLKTVKYGRWNPNTCSGRKSPSNARFFDTCKNSILVNFK